MHVLSVAFPDMSVGTATSGGAEQILSTVEQGLVKRGHRSTVIACKGSHTAGELIESSSPECHARAIREVLESCPVDLIHFHGLDFHRYLPRCDTPLLATLHLPIAFYPPWIFTTNRPSNLMLNCVSHSQAASSQASRALPVIPNGIPVEEYAPAEPEAALCWLGRICPEKGVHIALQVAHELDAPLVAAGPVHPYPEHLEYFSNRVKPLLDHKRVYVGPLEFRQKRSLLSRAHCLLVPSLVPETSSLVAMEALSSGTPVVAFRTGALPEIVEDSQSGFIVDSAETMVEAVSRVNGLSRRRCRRRAVEQFASARMIEGYQSLYERITTRHFGITCAPHENL